MTKDFGSTLFLVSTPFQCLCMLEAISYFKIDKYDILVTYASNVNDVNYAKIEVLLKKNKVSYSKRKVAHLLFDVLPFLFSIHKHYKNIFIGYLYSTPSFAIANIFALINANIYILDDGVQALSFFSPSPRIIKEKLIVKVVLFFYKIIGVIKFVKRPIFFTIFDVTSSKYQIINNPLLLLKSKLKKIKEKKCGVYIIGTNSSILNFKNYSYLQYLSALNRHILKILPDEIIYYCPHRADKNLKEIYLLCDKLNIKIFDTKVSVEYDFIENNINPRLVIGFTSNALYTLHIMYPTTQISTVMYNLESEEADKEMQIIRNKMNRSGISIIEVFE